MSETTSPSVHLHPISPSSSLSSTDSAPHSEPTSDEQPDLGAFTTVLREWTHLQPPPRIPVQIRSATSSTTPTFQPSIAGSVQSPSVRSRNSRISNRSIQSSFTRPPSSSAQPEEGSTVWAQGPIASYLLSSTPSNDYDDGYELDGGESEYTPSPPNSLESTSLTVEISSEIDIDFPSLDNDSIGRVDSSPHPYPIHSGVSPVPIPLQDESQRLDSRETAHPDEEIEIGIVEETSSGIGSTFRDQSITITTSSPQSHSRNVSQAESHLTSMQLQSQARPPPTTNASSLSLVSSGVDIIPSVSTISTTSSSQDHYSNTANSQSTTMSNIMNAIINRSRNPMPPRTTSDSSYTASESVSSNVSLVSYQVPETPPISLDEDSDNPTPSFPRSQISALSGSMSLKTQRSVPTSSSGSTSNASLATQRPNQPSSRTLHPSMGSSEYSTGSPLPNPHSPLPTPDSQLTQLFETNHNGWRATATRNQEIINDLGTPDQPPSETLIFDPPRERRGRAEFRPIIDDDDEDIIAARQPATVLTYSTLAGNVPTDATNSNKPHASRSHTSSYDGPGPSNISILGSTYSQPEHQTRLAHNSTMEPHNEDEEDEDDLSEEGYSSRYPYSHGVTPRFHGPALTPKGLPPPVESQTQTQTQTTTTFTSQLDPFSQPFFGQSTAPSTTQQTLTMHEQHDTSVSSQPQSQISTQQISSNLHAQTQQNKRTNMNISSSSHARVSYDPPISQSQPSTIQMSQSHDLQPYPAPSSSVHYPSSSQSRTQKGPGDAYTSKHGYPHSLLGLHALPASFISPDPEELPSDLSFHANAKSDPNGKRPQYSGDRISEPSIGSLADPNPHSIAATGLGVGDTSLESPLDQAVPSLGVLDGVLNFIAIERERARTNAAREALSSTADVDDSQGAGSGEGGEGGVGEEDWKHIVDNEQEHPRRKRRRKRPPRSHGAAALQSANSGVELVNPTSDSQGDHYLDNAGTAAVNLPPSKKKRSKSASASASASLHSLFLDGEAMKDHTKNKGKEKEFLVDPYALSKAGSSAKEKNDNAKPAVTILRRPVELLTKAEVLSDDEDRGRHVLSDADRAKTPTNSEQKSGSLLGDSPTSSPLNLTGKKGKRVGRREREKEMKRRDAIKEGMGVPDDRGQGTVGEDFEFGFDYDEDEDVNNDDGMQPHKEEENGRARGGSDREGEENDSLSNMALLQPPRRKRDRSRRRKARDTTYIHDVAGVIGEAYRSTPGTPGHLKEYDDDRAAEDLVEDQEVLEGGTVQGNVDEVDVFGSKINQGPVGEKKKRIRKRPKTLSHAKSVPDLKTEAEMREVIEVPAAVEGEDPVNLGVTKSKTGKKPIPQKEPDILDMDRTELENYLAVSYSSNQRLLMNEKCEAKSKPAPGSKRGRLLALANQLRESFPEQREELGKVIARITKQDASPGSKSRKLVVGKVDEGTLAELVKSRPVPVPDAKWKRSRKGGHICTGSEGTTGGEVFEDDEDIVENRHSVQTERQFPDPHEAEEEEEDIDPRGRPPKRGDVLIHVFIDHSNILIGLLSHLKRNQPQRRNFVKSARPLPAILTKATTSTNSVDKADPVSAFAAVKPTTTRPALPSNEDTKETINASKPTQMLKASSHPIPLPSFATISRSLPTKSALSTYMATKSNGRLSDEATGQRERDSNSDDYENDRENVAVGVNPLLATSVKIKEKKVLKHLWHAALILILERGRPVTRRVVVTSSPLYQPMDAIERLGYELRVFIRVPDLGDGQDRERHKDKNGSAKASGTGKGVQSSPGTTNPFSGVPISAKKGKSISHVRQASGSTSADSGSGGATGSGTASSGRNLHPYYGITNTSTPQTRVKFREQGVDELLQLKLHQALAATDDVPDGSAIVLATGDGNMGQFNEDGFLGPVRTALRRGWRVELYAWEDGLSRAWRREFGEGSEWGRRGMFRVIGMEQFASALVESTLA